MVNIAILQGQEFSAAIPALSKLRLQVFRAFPYLYDGDVEYETWYLERFAKAKDSFLAAAFDGDEIIGATTAAPLAGEMPEFRQPFQDAGYDVDKVFYFAESLLLARYRGHGIGHKFFDLREAHVRSFNRYEFAAFCAVVRPEDHPARPSDYRPLDGFWHQRGFSPQDGLITHFPWRDIGDKQETEKPMQFWIKDL